MNIERALESVIKQNKDKFVATAEINIAEMARDCLDEIRRLKGIIHELEATKPESEGEG